MSETQQQPLPAAPWINIPSDGSAPYLEGYRCSACNEVVLDSRPACPACRKRGTLTAEKLASRGTLYNFTIVHRSFPGVPVPFVSAIVDLEGGGCVKGNLIDIAPNAEVIKFDMPVEVVFQDAGRKDREGNSYLAYFFKPAN